MRRRDKLFNWWSFTQSKKMKRNIEKSDWGYTFHQMCKTRLQFRETTEKPFDDNWYQVLKCVKNSYQPPLQPRIQRRLTSISSRLEEFWQKYSTKERSQPTIVLAYTNEHKIKKIWRIWNQNKALVKKRTATNFLVAVRLLSKILQRLYSTNV